MFGPSSDIVTLVWSKLKIEGGEVSLLTTERIFSDTCLTTTTKNHLHLTIRRRSWRQLSPFVLVYPTVSPPATIAMSRSWRGSCCVEILRDTLENQEQFSNFQDMPRTQRPLRIDVFSVFCSLQKFF